MPSQEVNRGDQFEFRAPGSEPSLRQAMTDTIQWNLATGAAAVVIEIVPVAGGPTRRLLLAPSAMPHRIFVSNLPTENTPACPARDERRGDGRSPLRRVLPDAPERAGRLALARAVALRHAGARGPASSDRRPARRLVSPDSSPATPTRPTFLDEETPMLRWGRCVLIGAAVLAAGAASGQEACQERTLDVRFSPQAGHASNWCWAASGQMIMELLGEEPARACQCRQAEEVLGVQGCCVTSSSCVPADDVPSRCDEPRWPAFVERPEHYSFRYQTTCDGLPLRQDDEACDGKPLGWRELTDEICGGRPVIASLRSRGSRRGGTRSWSRDSPRWPHRRVLVVDPEEALPGGPALRGGAERRLLAHLRGVRRGLGRPRPLGRLLRDKAATDGKSGRRVRL